MAKFTKKTATEETGEEILAVAETAMKTLVCLRGQFDEAEMSYQTGRAGLYAVLARVFEQYAAIKLISQKVRAIEAFKALLENLDDDRAAYAKASIKTKASSLERLMLRIVCGDAFKDEREKAYASVLRKAFNQKVHEGDAGFVAWVIASGGVEVLRTQSKSRKPNEAVAAAAIQYKAAASGVKMPRGIYDVQKAATKDAHPDFYVAIVRRDTKSIVATTDQKSAVSATLNALGKGMTVAEAKKTAAAAKKAALAAKKAAAEAVYAKATSGQEKEAA